MSQTNLIINGTFDGQASGWSGTDIEATYNESAYLGNGSTNLVAEIDGFAGQTTVMQQSFTVTNPTATELTFDTALRTASLPQAGTEGFVVTILDSSGVAIASATVLPTTATMGSISIPVTFPAAGTYTVRFTEVGPNNSLGAIVDNIELLVCFAGSTRVETSKGTFPIQDLRVGDLVQTASGLKAVRWIGRRRVSAADIAKDPAYLPVKICAGALGCGLPTADLWVSRQHRMLVSSPLCERLFGQTDVLISAIRLTVLPGIYLDQQTTGIDYVHLLFDTHEVIFAEGAPSESLLFGPQARASLTAAALQEIALIFPDILCQTPAPAQLVPKGGRQTHLARRLARNSWPVLQSYSKPCPIPIGP